MLRFTCPHCSMKLTAREDRAGRTAACPHCKSKLTIPHPPEPELKLIREDSSTPLEPPAPVTFKAAPVPVAPDTAARERQQAQELLASLPPEPTPEYTGERKLFWLLDILLYPFSTTGLVTLAVMIGLPLISAFLGVAFFRLVRLAGWVSFGIGVLMGLYVLWYLAECVYDSAKGGTRAPEIIDADTSLNTLWARGSYLLAVYLVYVVPVLVYWGWMQRFDAIFWALAAWAVFFFPMSLLAMVINDSLSALNPFFLIASISRVFLSYVALVACLLTIIALLALLSGATLPLPMPHVRALVAISLLSLLANAYSSFLLAHILGRFYWRNRARLDWGI